MDVNKVLQRLVKYDKSLPAIKLAWNCELGLQDSDYIPRVSPSHYKREILLSTNERYSLLCNQQKKFELHKCGFEIIAIPSILAFQNCTIGLKSSIKLSLRNIGKLSQKATFFMDESFGFSIDPSSERVAKFAPGMTVNITVNFVPEDDHDYYHKLVVSTKNSRFAIPIIAIGSRGIIDIPDVFDFGDIPVKVLKKQRVLAYNSGSEPARFTLTTDGYFSVKPERGIVAPKDSFSFEISFIADYVQEYEGFVLIKYDNDEEVHSICKANAVDAEIYVCPDGFNFGDTYLGLKTRATTSIVNNSDEVVDFKWIKYITTADSGSNDEPLHLGDGDKSNTWKHPQESGPIIRSRSLSNDSHYTTTEIEDAFNHENFLIEPLLGKIQPHASIDVQAIFHPSIHHLYNVSAYLSITGLQDPVPVTLCGRGKGPEFKFNFDELDIGILFAGGNHEYEVALTNIGQIEGTIKFDELIASSSGSTTIMVKPEKLTLAPAQYGAFYIFVSCGGEPGDMWETLKFSVIKSGHSHKLTIRGLIDFPRMHFSTSEMYFGNVGYGFPTSQQVLLINDSLNTVMVYLEINEEGTEPPIDYNQLIETYKTKRIDDEDGVVYKEFTIEPHHFTLPPRGFQKITVTVCGHECRKIENELLGRIMSRGGLKTNPILSLPIQARCMTPNLQNGDPDLFLDEAYLHYPNEGNLQLKNFSKISACYYIVPVTTDNNSSGAPRYVGVAAANSTTTVPVTIIAHGVGKYAAFFDVYVLGRNQKLMTMTVKYDAAAAKLSVDSKKIEFGDIDVIVPSVQSIDIINDSPLTIPYLIRLLEGGKNGEVWEFDPDRGGMEPESKTKINFSVTLKEIGWHHALVRVQMQDAANCIDIKLTANGVGTSLTFDPPWVSNPQDMNFGDMFTKSSVTFTVQVTNMGHLPKYIEWLHLKDEPPPDPTLKTPAKVHLKIPTPTFKPKTPIRKSSKNKGRGNSSSDKSVESDPLKRHSIVAKPARKESFIFTIVPQKKLLQPMSTTTINFTAHSMIPHAVSEVYNLWCYSAKPAKDDNIRGHMIAIPRQSRGDINGGQTPYQESYKPMISQKVNLVAHFEAPKLHFSKLLILFRIDAFPSQTDFLQEDTIKVENKGTLPVTGCFETKFPFSIQAKHIGVEELTSYTHTFQSKEKIALTIKFDGQHLRKDRGNYTFEADLRVTYQEHPESATVNLRGEVNFPQVLIDKDVFDLGVIENGAEVVEEFTLTNPCNFCLTYKWYIKPRSTFIEYEPGELEQICLEKRCEETLQSDFYPLSTHSRYHAKENKRKESDEQKTKFSLHVTESHIAHIMGNDRIPDRKDNNHELNTVPLEGSVGEENSSNPKWNSKTLPISYKFVRSKRKKCTNKKSRKNKKSKKKMTPESEKLRRSLKASKELDRYGDWVQFVRNKYFRSRMMEVMGLHDSTKEKEDETNYLHHHPFEPKTINNFAISQLIDIVPLAGIIQAGQTQSFMLVFYGHSNVKLRTTAICYIEGGASKAIQITAQSKFIDNRSSTLSINLESLHSNTGLASNINKARKETQDKEKSIDTQNSVEGDEEEAEEEAEIITDKFKHRCAQRLLHPPVVPHRKTSKKTAKKKRIAKQSK